MIETLLAWKEQQQYRKPDDWVFASKRYRGRKPYWGQAILRKFILPRPKELGIEKRFGLRTFRHTYSTLLRSVGTEFKVMQELLRHSSLRSTFREGLFSGWPKQDRSRRRAYDSAELFVASGVERIGSLVPREVWRNSPRMVRLSVWEIPSK